MEVSPNVRKSAELRAMEISKVKEERKVSTCVKHAIQKRGVRRSKYSIFSETFFSDSNSLVKNKQNISTRTHTVRTM